MYNSKNMKNNFDKKYKIVVSYNSIRGGEDTIYHTAHKGSKKTLCNRSIQRSWELWESSAGAIPCPICQKRYLEEIDQQKLT